MSEGSNFARQKFERLALIAADRDLPPSAARVAIVLLGFMGPKHRVAYPSVETLCERLGMSRSGVLAALAKLVERKHLKRETGGGRPRRGAPRTTSRFSIPSGAKTVHDCGPIDEPNEPETVHDCGQKGSTNPHENRPPLRTRTLEGESRHAESLSAHQRGGCAAKGVLDWNLKKQLLKVPQPLRHRARRNGLTEREIIDCWDWVECSRYPGSTATDDQVWDHFCNITLEERGAA